MAEMTPDLTLPGGNKIPRVGFGTSVAAVATMEQQIQVEEAVKSALRLGYRHIDTAALYNTEEPVGRALKACISEGTLRRQDVFVTTKLWCTCHREELVEPALRQSLQKLNLDYVDLYLIHNPVSLKPGKSFLPRDSTGKFLYDEEHTDTVTTWKAMEQCQKLGLARSIGLSNFNERQIQRILDSCSIRPAVVQLESHPYNKNVNLVDFCCSKGIAINCWSPLFPKTKTRSTELSIYDNAVLKDIAARHHTTVAQVALRFQLQRGLTVVVNSKSPSHQAENLNVFTFSLSEEEMTRIFDIPQKYRLSSHFPNFSGAREYQYDD